jgi:hypothetical protein
VSYGTGTAEGTPGIATMTNGKFIAVSSDGGATWKNVPTPVTLANPWGLTYSAALNAYFAWEINGHVQRIDVAP